MTTQTTNTTIPIYTPRENPFFTITVKLISIQFEKPYVSITEEDALMLESKGIVVKRVVSERFGPSCQVSLKISSPSKGFYNKKLNQSRTNKKELKQQSLIMVKSIDKNPFSSLSDREREILELMLQGESVKGISTSLSLKSNTISTYKKLIFYKTGVDNNIDLYKLARKHKIAK